MTGDCSCSTYGCCSSHGLVVVLPRLGSNRLSQADSIGQVAQLGIWDDVPEPGTSQQLKIEGGESSCVLFSFLVPCLCLCYGSDGKDP
jgi:hypothetical protein